MSRFSLPELPYGLDSLEPSISRETLEYHYGKHHKAYVDNLNNLLDSAPIEFDTLEDLIKSSSGAVFNNAAQVWNHSFYWLCLTGADVELDNNLKTLLAESFGSFQEFKQLFLTAAKTLFGSGWVWLVLNADGSLSIRSTANANTPLTSGQRPLLVCDVWEHAYYVDVRNSRPEYLEKFWELINWNFVADQLVNPYKFPG